MMDRRGIVALIVAAFVLGACGSRGPSAEELAQMRADSIAAERAAEQARQDSIAAAERAAAQARADSLAAEQRRAAMAAEEAARAREIIAEMVHFDYDRAEVRDDARDVLTRKVAVLRANPRVRVRIEGHADERGSVEYNLVLGERRAQQVRDFLVNFGISANRFEVATFGEERPLDPRDNERAWAQNRRAEFRIISGDGDLVMPEVSP